ncbi:uncharacterized protein LOC108094205 [Drosophila ficusphila]|uniref:uncharacterized protein LOC108094205 n=1 Tax=Drosophila ficusphila TaxID=30025 RepID=UPI0007E80717|nr:uncharacterized protein LOC108094205 [Drosophila ficusphila]
MPNISKEREEVVKKQTESEQISQANSLSLRPIITPSHPTMNSRTNSSPSHPNNAVVNPAELFSSMRIPDPIRFLPPYSGDPFTLNEFITNVEEIILMIRGTDQTPYGRMLLRAIRQKIEGKANAVVIASGAGLIWDEIRDALIRHCRDRRDEETLMTELYNLRRKQLSLQRSYDQISKIKLALFTIIQTEETEPVAIRVRQKIVSQTCLTTFLAGLRGNLGAKVRAFRPAGLEEAYERAIKERNLYFTEKATQLAQNKQPSRRADRFRTNQSQYQNRGYNQYQDRDYNRYHIFSIDRSIITQNTTTYKNERKKKLIKELKN